tara:strand:- start:388 stop:2067 length:1680 start_codon:yes stop_codon:yes gene_type:complete
MIEILEQLNINNVDDDLFDNCNIIKKIIKKSNNWYTPKFNDIIAFTMKINNQIFSYDGELISDMIPVDLCECLFSMQNYEISEFEINKELFLDEIIDFCIFCKKNLSNKKCDISDFNIPTNNTDVIVQIEINNIYSYSYINGNVIKYCYKDVQSVNNPTPYDEIKYRMVEESIIDNPNCLDKIEIKQNRLNIIDIDNKIKSCILRLKKGEICILHIDDKKYTVELIDWSRIYMIDLDKDIYMKKIIQNNSTERIGYEYEVTYELNNNTYTNIVGNGEISIQIEKCLYNMTRGDHVIIYNDNETETNLKLIDYKYNKLNMTKLSDSDKYYLGLDKKNSGNELYKKQKYALAITKYKYGIQIIKELKPFIKSMKEEHIIGREMNDIKKSMQNVRNRMTKICNKEETENDKSVCSENTATKIEKCKITHDSDIDNTELNTSDTINEIEEKEGNNLYYLNVKQLHISLMMNICQCFMKLSDYKNTIDLCAQILKLDKNNYKTLYRKGYAYLKNNDTDRAKEFLLKAKEINSSDKCIIEALSELKKQNKINNEKDKTVFKDIFK